MSQKNIYGDMILVQFKFNNFSLILNDKKSLQ